MKQLPRWVPWAILAVVVVAGGWYVTSLRGEVRRLKGAAPGDPAAGPSVPTAAKPADTQPPPAPADPAGAWQLTDVERAAMLFHLGADGTSTDNPIWFVTDTRSVEAVAMQRSLRRVFEEAGWQVRGNVPATFPLKPGIFFMSADEEPPAYVETAHGAFEAAGLSVSAGRGYRSFYKEMKAKDPNWRGFDMAADQTYVVVVGRRPPPPTEPAPAAPAPAPMPE